MRVHSRVVLRQNLRGGRGGISRTEAPIASVPTGMPRGICTMGKGYHAAYSAALCTGTPITGTSVFAAIIPAGAPRRPRRQ